MSLSLATFVAVFIALILGAFVGYLLRLRKEHADAGPISEQTQKLLDEAQTEAESLKRDAQLQAKELVLQARTEAEEITKRELAELTSERERLLKREEQQEKKDEELERAEATRAKKEAELERRDAAADAALQQAREKVAAADRRLEELAQLSQEQARQQLIEQVKDEAKTRAAAEIKRIEEETEREARERATTILASAVQRYASEYVGERTVTVVPLPSDDLKGRIIGREGRNIRALEAATGVDLIIDDTPEAVILSCFDPERREVASLALQRLLGDGRIHPSRVEEVVQRCRDEVEARGLEEGEQAVFDLGLNRVHPELVKLLGKLRLRSSFAQNLLQHSVEVGYIAGVIASEIGYGVKQARRAGLLHDIGKAVSHETEGSHAAVGAAVARKCGESARIVQAILAHHGEVPPVSVLDHIVDVSNRLSAQRPGARKERLEAYVKRLGDLEQICRGHKGVEKAYAIQAGREVRVLVEHETISDEMTVMLSKEIARQIEDELAYPGQIKVCVVRETRATDIAH